MFKGKKVKWQRCLTGETNGLESTQQHPELTIFHSISHIKYLLKGTEIITLSPETQWNNNDLDFMCQLPLIVLYIVSQLFPNRLLSRSPQISAEKGDQAWSSETKLPMPGKKPQSLTFSALQRGTLWYLNWFRKSKCFRLNLWVKGNVSQAKLLKD